MSDDIKYCLEAYNLVKDLGDDQIIKRLQFKILEKSSKVCAECGDDRKLIEEYVLQHNGVAYVLNKCISCFLVDNSVRLDEYLGSL